MKPQVVAVQGVSGGVNKRVALPSHPHTAPLWTTVRSWAMGNGRLKCWVQIPATPAPSPSGGQAEKAPPWMVQGSLSMGALRSYFASTPKSGWCKNSTLFSGGHG